VKSVDTCFANLCQLFIIDQTVKVAEEIVEVEFGKKITEKYHKKRDNGH